MSPAKTSAATAKQMAMMGPRRMCCAAGTMSPAVASLMAAALATGGQPQGW